MIHIRNYIITLIFLLCSITGFGQTVVPSGSPGQVTDFKGGIKAAKTLNLPVTDADPFPAMDKLGQVRISPTDSIMRYFNGIEWKELFSKGDKVEIAARNNEMALVIRDSVGTNLKFGIITEPTGTLIVNNGGKMRYGNLSFYAGGRITDGFYDIGNNNKSTFNNQVATHIYTGIDSNVKYKFGTYEDNGAPYISSQTVNGIRDILINGGSDVNLRIGGTKLNGHSSFFPEIAASSGEFSQLISSELRARSSNGTTRIALTESPEAASGSIDIFSPGTVNVNASQGTNFYGPINAMGDIHLQNTSLNNGLISYGSFNPDSPLLTDNTLVPKSYVDRTIANGADLQTVLENGSSVTLNTQFSLAVRDTINGSSLNLYPNGDVGIGGNGDITLSTSKDIRLSNGGNTWIGGSGNTNISGSGALNVSMSGGLTVFGGAGGQITTDPALGIRIAGNAGGITLSGSSQGIVADGGGGDIELNGGSGGLVFRGQGGPVKFETGSGTLEFNSITRDSILVKGSSTFKGIVYNADYSPNFINTSLVDKLYVDTTIETSSSQLEKITEGSNTGWRLKGYNPDYYGDIGGGAVDLSVSEYNNYPYGATGTHSFAEGYITRAIGTNSHAEGQNTQASGSASHAQGENTTASGRASHAGGYSVMARSFGETAIGVNGTDYTPDEVNFFSANDRIFSIGNGYSGLNLSDALITYKDGTSIQPSTTVAEINNRGSKAIPTVEWVNSALGTLPNLPAANTTGTIWLTRNASTGVVESTLPGYALSTGLSTGVSSVTPAASATLVTNMSRTWGNIIAMRSYAAKTASYTLAATDDVIDFTAATNSTATLPTAASIAGEKLFITNSGAGVVTMAATSGQTIGSLPASSYTLSQGGVLIVASDGANWKVLSYYNPAAKSGMLNITANTILTASGFGPNGQLDIYANAATAPITITLPGVAAMAGYQVNIIKTDASSNAVTIQGAGGININQLNTYSLPSLNSNVSIKSNSTQYWLF